MNKRPFPFHILVCLLITGIILIAYSNVYQHPFMMDDDTHFFIPKNLGAVSYYEIWTGQFDQFYRPFVYTLFKAFHQGVGLQGWAYHALNVVLFIGLCWLIFAWVLRLFGRRDLALLTALLYAVHPVNHFLLNYKTASVLIMEIILTLGCLFFLTEHFDKGRKRVLIGALVLGLMAMFSHEIGVMIPLYAAFLFYFRKDRSWTGGLKILLVFGAAPALFFVIRSQLLTVQPLSTTLNGGVVEHISTVGYLIGWYVSKLVWPWDVFFIWNTRLVTDGLWGLGLLLTALFAVFCFFRSSGKSGPVLIGAGIFLLGFVVTAASVFTYTAELNTAMIEPHWFGFSSIGFFIIIANAFLIVTGRLSLKLRRSLMTVVVVLLMTLTYVHNQQWSEPKSFFKSWLRRNALTGAPWHYLAREYFREMNVWMKTQPADECSRFMNYTRALQIKNRGEEVFQAYLSYGNENNFPCAEAHYNLSLMYGMSGQSQLEKYFLLEGIKRDPDFKAVHDVWRDIFLQRHGKDGYRRLEKAWKAYKEKTGLSQRVSYFLD